MSYRQRVLPKMRRMLAQLRKIAPAMARWVVAVLMLAWIGIRYRVKTATARGVAARERF